MTTTDAAAPARTGYRYYVLAILILVYTLNFLDRQIIGILAAPLKAEFNLTDSQFGLLGGIAFASVYSTLAIPLAWVADRFSRVWVMTGALAVWSGFTALCGTAGSFGQLFLFRMGVGVGEAGGVAPAYSLISDYFPPEQRARALAAFAFGIPLGMAAGTLVGGLLAVAYGWRAEEQAKNAEQVAKLGKELYKRLSVMGAHAASVGRALESAVGKYNQFVGSLESQVMVSARRFEDLQVDHEGKDLPELAPVEQAPRQLSRPELVEAKPAGIAEAR